jgi:hypothetical protein
MSEISCQNNGLVFQTSKRQAALDNGQRQFPALPGTARVSFLSMDAKREAQIQQQIEKLKQELVALGDLWPGSLSTTG